ncbi:hook-length control protein FliK [Ectothiorhodospira magna]|uniref:Hook-length control protein FliK n=1 Tax=Ectothiorhodospira magna TaxID=867345 RepID=A0A1H9DWZ5_9GAMM|nr:hook-length control protein FliK [Ectothiorhodospira magna]
MQLRLAGETLEFRLPIPVQTGDQLKLLVNAVTPRLELTLLREMPAPPPSPMPPTTTVIPHLVRQWAPLQAAQGPLLASIHHLVQPDNARAAPLPEGVNQALQRLWQVLPTAEQVTTPQGLRQAILNSGLFYEARLVQATGMSTPRMDVAQDLKARLLSLAEQLRALPVIRPRHAAGESVRGPFNELLRPPQQPPQGESPRPSSDAQTRSNPNRSPGPILTSEQARDLARMLARNLTSEQARDLARTLARNLTSEQVRHLINAQLRTLNSPHHPQLRTLNNQQARELTGALSRTLPRDPPRTLPLPERGATPERTLASRGRLPAGDIPPPLKHSNPVPQARAPVAPVAMLMREPLLDLLRQQVEQSMARLVIHQLSARDSTDDSPLPRWLLELALRGEQGVDVVHMRLDRDARRNKDQEDADDYAWKADLAMDLPELGPLRIRVMVRENSVSIQFWAVSATTQQHIDQALPQLKTHLESRNLEVQGLTCRQGTPPNTQPGRQDGDDALIDSHA